MKKRKKTAALLLLGALLTITACSGEKAEEPDAGTTSNPPRTENTTLPENTSEPREAAKTNAISEISAAPESKATQEPAAPQSAELDSTVEERIASIKIPGDGYTFSCDKDKVIFYSRGEEYGWLAPYEITPEKGVSEIDSIIRDLSGASGITELIDTCEEGNAARYVFAVHRSRYAMAEVEFLAQAGIISEEEALAQEKTELFIAYKVNGNQWWGFNIKSDEFGGQGLLDALKFEIVFN